MKFLPWIVATVALASLAPTPAPAASGGPVNLIYRFSGVFDDGGGTGAGSFSALHCSNFSAAAEDLIVAVRQWDGTLLTARTFTAIPAFHTFTVVTHFGAVPFGVDSNLAIGVVNQGMFVIASTTTTITCTAMIVSGTAPTIQGVELHAHRYNPEPGTDE
jgi:hypothetical protein